MKTIRITQGVLAAGVLAAALSASPLCAQEMLGQQAQPQLPMPQPVRDGNVTYVTGGIGEDERASLESQRQNYDLQVINSDRSGAYMADTTIAIRGTGNNGTLIDVSGTGPLFYAQLPPGRYTIQATNGDKQITKRVDLSGQQPKDVHLVW
jgi:hypothetical protein